MISPAAAPSAVFNQVVSREMLLSATTPARVAILCDIVEENWPSMDLVGEMLFEHLRRDHAHTFAATRLSPPMRRRLTRLRPQSRNLFNADRLMNRFWDYQRWMQPRKQEYDLFHVIDHSYSQLLHSLPAERTIISCHDLDTFRCLLEPQKEPRSRMFRTMMQHVLNGFRKAAAVTCDSAAIRGELLAHDLIAPERVRVIPLGVHPACTPEPNPAADDVAGRLLNRGRADAINLLHVGSTIERKRIDVLLEVCAGVRKAFPKARLVRVGGPFTPTQMKLAKHFKLEDAIIVLPHLTREVLAAVYRQSALVLQPSEREGFGLPLIEALACGTRAVASDLPVLREVGGHAVRYAPVADTQAWTEAVASLLAEREQHRIRWVSGRAAGIEQATKFSWARYARTMVELYREILA